MAQANGNIPTNDEFPVRVTQKGDLHLTEKIECSLSPGVTTVGKLEKALQNLQQQIDNFEQRDLTQLNNLNKLEQHALDNVPVVSNYINYLVQSGLKYLEFTQISNGVAATWFKTFVGPAYIETTYTGRTRQISLNLAKMKFAFKLHQLIHTARAQASGDVDVNSRDHPEDALFQVVASHTVSNTEMVQGADVSSPLHLTHGADLQEQATTEPIYNYPLMTERFVRISTFTLNVGDAIGAVKYTVDLPDGIYDALDSTTAAVLRAYTSISCDVELIFKVNANQAQCGRAVVAHFPGRKLAPTASDNVYRQLQREHAIIDVAASNDVVYVVPYEYVRPWIPIQSNEAGLIEGGNFATLTVSVLSPVRIAESGNNACPVQVFARLRNVKLTGMRYPVQPQSDIVPRESTIQQVKMHLQRSGIEQNPGPDGQITDPQIPGTSQSNPGDIKEVGDPPVVSEQQESKPTFAQRASKAFSAIQSILTIGQFILKGAALFTSPISSVASILHPMLTTSIEKTMNYFGGYNKDHPADISSPSPLLPQANHSFANVLGAVPLRKLRMEQTSNTPQFHDFNTTNTPRTVSEIAQIPSFYTSFEVTAAQQSGALLVELPVVPLDPRYTYGPMVPAPVEANDPRSYAQLPTVSYMSLLFTDYVGPLQYEFDAVKTPSHNFSMQVAYVPFNGTPGNTTIAQMQSCKWVTIDFRANNRAKFISPFVSFHLMRQYPNAFSGKGDQIQNVLYASGNTPINSGINYAPNVGLSFSQGMRDPGKIVVRLVNPLNNTPIVSDSIQIIVYVSAAPGFKYLIPRPFRGIPSAIPNISSENRSDVANPNGFSSDSVNAIAVAQSDTQAGDEMTPSTLAPKILAGTLIQAMECHDDILNICRRNYFYSSLTATYYAAQIDDSGTISAYSDQPMISTIPLSHYCYPSRAATRGNTSPFSQTRGPMNPREALLTCFRWARGGMNVTVVLKPDNGYDKKQIMVTHIPPVGPPQHYSGNQDFPVIAPIDNLYAFGPSGTNTPGCGYSSELLVPSVNPIMTVEVPFYTPVNYVDLQAPLNAASFPPANDLTTWTLGQLNLETISNIPTGIGQGDPYFTQNQFKVNLYSSFADDTVLHHFMGTPPTGVNATMRNMAMTGGLQVSRAITREQIQTELLRSGVESNPGPAVQSHFQASSEHFDREVNATVTPQSDGWWQTMKSIVKLPTAIARLANTADAITTKFEEVKLHLCALVPDVTYLQVSAAIAALITAYQHPNTLTVVTAVLTFVSLFPIFVSATIDTLITRSLGLCRPTTDVVPQADDPSGTNTGIVAIFTALLVEGLLVRDKVALMPNHESTVMGIVTRYLGSINYARTGAVCILAYRLCGAITALWTKLKRWCESYKSVSLLEVDQNFIDNFMVDYEYVMNEVNSDVFNFTRLNKDRYWTTVISAYYLQSIMAKHKTVNPIIKMACTQVITRANTLNSKVTAPPVRYEPFVMWLHGAPGVGKSTAANELLVLLAKNINIEYPADPIYVVNPTSQYMNGLKKQPICLFDDAGAISDNTVEPTILSNFMAMKSCARMLVDMPRLEDKDAEFSAPIVGVLSNYKYWPVTNSVRNKAALDRRRDVMVRAQFSRVANAWFQENGGARIADRLPQEMVQRYDHIEYVVEFDYIRETDRANQTNYPPPLVPKSHTEFVEYLKEQHKNYHDREVQKMYNRYKNSLILSRKAAENLQDEASLKLALLSISIGCEEASSDVPYDVLRYALFRLEQSMPEYYRTLPSSTRQQLSHMSQTYVAPQSDTISLNAIFDQIPSDASPWFTEAIQHLVSRDPSPTILQRAALWLQGQSTSQVNYLPQWLRPCGAPFEIQVNTPCAVCGKDIDDLNHANEFKAICPRSTSENQHWACYECFDSLQAHAPLGATITCPTCRSSNFFQLTEQQQQISRVKKIWYFTKLIGSMLRRGATHAAHYSVIALVVLQATALVAIAGAVVHNAYQSATYLDDMQWYLTTYGVPPEDYAGRMDNGEPIFIHDGTTHVRTNGILQPIGIANAQSDTQLPPQQLPYRSIPVLPTVDREQCIHAPARLDDATLYVSFNEEDESTTMLATIPRDEEPLELVSWDMSYCRVDGDNANCVLFNTREKLFSRIIECNSIAWSFEPELIPPIYKPLMTLSDDTERGVVRKYLQIQRDIVIRIRNNVVPVFARVLGFINNYLKSIVTLVALLVGVYYGYRLLYNDEEGWVPEVQAQASSGSYDDVRPQHMRARVNQNRVLKRPTHVSGQSEHNITVFPKQVQTVATLFKKAVVLVRHPASHTDAIGVQGSKILMPRHAYQTILQFENGHADTLVIHNNFSRYVKLSELPAVDWKEIELVLVTLPTCFSFRNITMHFNPSVQSEMVIPPQLWCYSPAKERSKYANVIGTAENFNIVGDYVFHNVKYSYKNNVRVMIQVKDFQDPGLCMAIAMNDAGHVIAIHVGGAQWNNAGFLAPIYADQFDATAQSLGSMRYITTVDDAPYHTRDSKIRPSLLAPAMQQSITEPCIQSRNDPRLVHDSDPLIEGCKTIGAPTKSPDIQILTVVEDAIFEKICDKFPIPFTSVPTTMDRALNPGTPKCKPLDKDSSNGYPLCNKYQKKGDVFQVLPDGTIAWLKSEVRTDLEQKFSERTNGIRPPTVYWAHLKDERRKPEKNRALGGTRVFHVVPLELIVSTRRLMLPFIDAFLHDPISSHHGIALSPESTQWTEMMATLTEKGRNLVQLDFSKFSDTMPHEFVLVFFNLVKRWYNKYQMLDEQVECALRTIEYDIMFSQVLVYSDIFQITNGVLQGHPLTATLNSMVNIIEQVYVYSKITGNLPLQFFEDCGLMVMGDDVVISVPDHLLGIYNSRTIAKKFAEMDIAVTDPFDKLAPLDRMPLSYGIKDFVLLSRTATLHPTRNVLLAPVKMQSLLDVPLWVKGRANLETTKEVVLAALVLGYTHGVQFFTIWREYICTAYEAVGHEAPILPTWGTIDHAFFRDAPLRDTPITTSCACTFDCLQTLKNALIETTTSSDRVRAAVAAYILGKRFNEPLITMPTVGEVPSINIIDLNTVSAEGYITGGSVFVSD